MKKRWKKSAAHSGGGSSSGGEAVVPFVEDLVVVGGWEGVRMFKVTQ